MEKIKEYIKRRLIFVVMLMTALYFGCLAIWNLSNTLLYVHEAVTLTATVRDMRQRPFESFTEALSYGNMPWNGDIAYTPILSFTMPAGIPIRAHAARDLDNTDYKIGEQVEIITPPYDSNQAHINKWKFLWGADCMRLLLALLLGIPAWLVLFPRKKRSKAAPKAKKQASSQKSTSRQQQTAERAPRKKQSSASTSSSSAPRAPRKKSSKAQNPRKNPGEAAEKRRMIPTINAGHL